MGKESKQTFYQRRHIKGQQVREKMSNNTNHQEMQNQNHNIPSQLLKSVLSKRQEIKSVDVDMGKENPYVLLVGM